MQVQTTDAPVRAIEQPLPGRPPLPGTGIPGEPTSIPYRPPMPGMEPDTGETVPRPLTPDTNIPDTGEAVPRPDLPDPGAPATPDDESGFANPGGAGDAADTTTLVPVPAPA